MHAIGTLLAAVALPFLALIPLPSTPSRYVTDAAGVLDDGREAALNEQLAAFERQTSKQLLAVTSSPLSLAAERQACLGAERMSPVARSPAPPASQSGDQVTALHTARRIRAGV